MYFPTLIVLPRHEQITQKTETAYSGPSSLVFWGSGLRARLHRRNNVASRYQSENRHHVQGLSITRTFRNRRA